jgi:hypothetical protein
VTLEGGKDLCARYPSPLPKVFQKELAIVIFLRETGAVQVPCQSHMTLAWYRRRCLRAAFSSFFRRAGDSVSRGPVSLFVAPPPRGACLPWQTSGFSQCELWWLLDPDRRHIKDAARPATRCARIGLELVGYPKWTGQRIEAWARSWEVAEISQEVRIPPTSFKASFTYLFKARFTYLGSCPLPLTSFNSLALSMDCRYSFRGLLDGYRLSPLRGCR